MEQTKGMTLAELATRYPAASRVFHQHRIDYCCGGDRTLAEACEGTEIDPVAMLEEIEKQAQTGSDARWDESPLVDLIDHILADYHEPLRADIPGLLEMASKVESVHADKASCPSGLSQHLERMAEELESHMQKEEQVLFPMIRSGLGAMATMPISIMEREHDDHGANLRRTRELTGDFQPPEDACTTWKALYMRLEELEAALMRHVHLENNVLFKRALAGDT